MDQDVYLIMTTGKLPTCCGLVADMLATRQTILTYQDVANKSATSWQQVDVMKHGKRHTTDTRDFSRGQLGTYLLRICFRETGVMDFEKTYHAKVAYLLRTCVMDSLIQQE